MHDARITEAATLNYPVYSRSDFGKSFLPIGQRLPFDRVCEINGKQIIAAADGQPVIPPGARQRSRTLGGSSWRLLCGSSPSLARGQSSIAGARTASVGLA